MDNLIERIDAAGNQVALNDFFDPWVDAIVTNGMMPGGPCHN
ncbi:hypothetical protein [Actinosynnema sp. ALI-1.44]|nr:hypothetical protein [Actinosynnema sp. ALI-1.44]